MTVDPWPFAADRFAVLLVGYRAEGYPHTLDRVVEPIAFARQSARVTADDSLRTRQIR